MKKWEKEKKEIARIKDLYDLLDDFNYNTEMTIPQGNSITEALKAIKEIMEEIEDKMNSEE